MRVAFRTCRALARAWAGLVAGRPKVYARLAMVGRGQVRTVAAVVGLTLVGAPVHAAGPSGPLALRAPAKAAKPKADDPLAKAGALAQDAQTRFETADYSGAIDLWTQAYAALPDEPAYAGQRSVLAYQIAQACVEAYAIDPNLLYLRKAERLFQSYRETIDPADKETAEDVQKTLDDLRSKIAEAEARAAASGDAKQAEFEAAERERAEQAAREAAERQRREEAEAAKRRAGAEREARRYKGLTLAGAGVAAWGAASLGVMAFGLARGASVDRQGEEAVAADGAPDQAQLQELLDKGNTANKIAIAFGAVGGALIVTGVGLVAAGTAGYNRAKRDLAVAPGWLPGGGSVSLKFRL
jgi:hypothetical protein